MTGPVELMRYVSADAAKDARLAVCARATDAVDAAELLWMLGLLPVEPPTGKGKVGTNTRDFASRRHGLDLYGTY